MFVHRSAAVQAALVAGTRTNRARQAQIRRTVNAALREAGRSMTDPSDAEQVRDYEAEEREALAAQRKRDDDVVEQQRQRE
jgi:outer membrane lipopolysaccharide assembly protein LptE/RlpB